MMRHDDYKTYNSSLNLEINKPTVQNDRACYMIIYKNCSLSNMTY